jgi:hypothetical protein
MACIDSVTGVVPWKWRIAKTYTKKEDCERECDGVTGACTYNGACKEVLACQCYQDSREWLFMGAGTKCNPLP